MNFRTMPGSNAFLLIDNENNQKVVGWQGYAINPLNNQPEKFSLHLDDDYRAFLLGLALETAYYWFFDQLGHKWAWLRMDKNSTQSLYEYRKKTGIAVEVANSELESDWIQQCSGCELFKKSCADQVYFKLDVKRGLLFGQERLGPLDLSGFPLKIELVEAKIRKESREKRFQAKWAG